MTNLKKITVIGSGTMGQGIAQWFAQNDVQVEIFDKVSEFTESAKLKIENSWDKLEKKNKFTAEQVKQFKTAIQYSNDWSSLAKDSQLFIEAIPENMELKKELFSKAHEHFSSHTVFATNTSSLSVDALCSDLPIERKKKFLGLHFFNPAPIMKLVEVIMSHWSEEETIENLFSFFEEKGKVPALCRNFPGFIVNRVARNFYGEALRAVHEDTPEEFAEIDTILKEVGGFRMGPFELMDLIGVDVNYEVTKSVWKDFHYEPRFAPHLIQKKLVEARRFGRKAGEGFYQY